MSFRKDRSLDELARVGNIAQFVSFAPIDGRTVQQFSRISEFDANHVFPSNGEAIATLLAAQTMKGAASVVLETGDHPALLKDAVTTPAGCTIDGIMELEEGKLRVTLIKAVVKATSRAGELLFEK